MFNKECLKAFEHLKEKLIYPLVNITPNWSKPFELMCDASRFTLGVILGQRRENMFHPIYYNSNALNGA